MPNPFALHLACHRGQTRLIAMLVAALGSLLIPATGDAGLLPTPGELQATTPPEHTQRSGTDDECAVRLRLPLLNATERAWVADPDSLPVPARLGFGRAVPEAPISRALADPTHWQPTTEGGRRLATVATPAILWPNGPRVGRSSPSRASLGSIKGGGDTAVSDDSLCAPSPMMGVSRRAPDSRCGNMKSGIAIDSRAALVRTTASIYPEPFASLTAGRDKRPLGDLFGLMNFGVNLTHLAPNATSLTKHQAMWSSSKLKIAHRETKRLIRMMIFGNHD